LLTLRSSRAGSDALVAVSPLTVSESGFNASSSPFPAGLA
jgi:hypothetical protein